MAAKKTKAKAGAKGPPTRAGVKAYLDAIPDPTMRRDARGVAKLLGEESGEKPAMWGGSMVGFGSYHYKYESGREGDFFRVGFSVRKSGLVLYMPTGYEHQAPLMSKLGKHSIGKSCLYIKRLSDVDEKVLRELVRRSLAWIDKAYPA